MLEWFEGLLSQVSGVVWGPPMLVLLFGTHLFLTFRLRFIQRHLGTAVRLSLKRDGGGGDISPFGALTTALAATVGTGNIIGVATAVSLGGPGAVLWMWLTGVFGVATKYAEALLSVKYRVRDASGAMAGGPMYVLERGLGLRWMGMLFAALTVIASFGIGNMLQANALSHLLKENAGVPQWGSGLVMSLLTALVILGGIKSIARVCQMLVPFMALFYIGGCLVLLVLHADTLPETVVLILKSAFTGQAAAGGFLGAGVREAVRFGIARGLFSNESGMGSAPIVAAAAQTRNPVRQALVSASGTFWDTVVICLMTGLVVVNSGKWQEGLEGAQLSQATFATLPVFGPLLLTVGMATFVFSTILGWSYYGEKSCEYLAGAKTVFVYRVCWIAAVSVGANWDMQPIWDFADVANALMAVPNLIALLLLSGVVVAETRKYLWEGNLDMESADEAPQEKP